MTQQGPLLSLTHAATAAPAPSAPQTLLLLPPPPDAPNLPHIADASEQQRESWHSPARRRPAPLVALSVSLGSSKRNSRSETTLLGRHVILSRVGVDGDRSRARALFEEMDGKVDAFGFGGADMGVTVDGRSYAFTSLASLTAGLQTPVVDGAGLRSVIERRIAQNLPPSLTSNTPHRVLITTAVDRYDMLCSFVDAGYEVLCGDLGFVFGVPLAIRSRGALNLVARTLLPAIRRLPFEMLYPTGKKQEQSHAAFPRWFNWASFVGGDFHFLSTHLPARLDGKVVVTNTTTREDVDLLRQRGARALVTSTPRVDGRSFGSNVVEAALTAIAGKGRPLTHDELADLIGDELPPSVIDFAQPDA